MKLKEKKWNILHHYLYHNHDPDPLTSGRMPTSLMIFVPPTMNIRVQISFYIYVLHVRNVSARESGDFRTGKNGRFSNGTTTCSWTTHYKRYCSQEYTMTTFYLYYTIRLSTDDTWPRIAIYTLLIVLRREIQKNRLRTNYDSIYERPTTTPPLRSNDK